MNGVYVGPGVTVASSGSAVYVSRGVGDAKGVKVTVLVAVGIGVPKVGDGVGVFVASGVGVWVGVLVGLGVRVGRGVEPGTVVLSGSRALGSRVARGVGVGSRCFPESLDRKSHELSTIIRNRASAQAEVVTPALAARVRRAVFLVGITQIIS
jgi:hypothetical protein